MTPYASLFQNQRINGKLTLPASASLSLYHAINDKLAVMADISWTDWSSFDELVINFEGSGIAGKQQSITTEKWHDSWRYSVGFDYQATDALVLRAGLALDETPIPSSERRTPRIPGDDRTWVSLGLTYVASDAFSFDVGYSHLFIDDVDIDNTLENAVPSTNATLTGEYEAEVDILSAQLNWKID